MTLEEQIRDARAELNAAREWKASCEEAFKTPAYLSVIAGAMIDNGYLLASLAERKAEEKLKELLRQK